MSVETIQAKTPEVYMQPHMIGGGDQPMRPPQLHVCGYVVKITDKNVAASWIRMLTDYVLDTR